MATNTKPASDEAQIRSLVDDHVNALRAKDADRVVSHYAADNVMFILAPPLRYTGDNTQGKKGVEEWFATWRGPLGYEFRDLSITVGNDVAFSHSLNRMSGTKTDGENVDMWLRETLGFRKIGGEWKITHQHDPCPSTWTAAFERRPISSRSTAKKVRPSACLSSSISTPCRRSARRC